MSYKSILTLINNSAQCEAWTQYAIGLALHNRARLVGVASREMANSLMPGEMVTIDSSWLTELQNNIDAEAAKAKQAFEKRCASGGLESVVATTVGDAPLPMLRDAAHENDLIVLGQYYSTEVPSASLAGLAESLLMTAAGPIMIIPAIGSYAPDIRKVLVAWRSSRESSQALRHSLPVLVQADEVEIVTVDSGRSVNAGEEDLAGLVEYLKLHGVSATGKHIMSDEDPANILLSEACDYGADLLVMGAYGHARLREWALGGVTKTILQSMTLPVLMAH